MDGNDWLKWYIGDLAYQLASCKGQVGELESLVAEKDVQAKKLEQELIELKVGSKEEPNDA